LVVGDVLFHHVTPGPEESPCVHVVGKVGAHIRHEIVFRFPARRTPAEAWREKFDPHSAGTRGRFRRGQGIHQVSAGGQRLLHPGLVVGIGLMRMASAPLPIPKPLLLLGAGDLVQQPHRRGVMDRMRVLHISHIRSGQRLGQYLVDTVERVLKGWSQQGRVGQILKLCADRGVRLPTRKLRDPFPQPTHHLGLFPDMPVTRAFAVPLAKMTPPSRQQSMNAPFDILPVVQLADDARFEPGVVIHLCSAGDGGGNFSRGHK